MTENFKPQKYKNKETGQIVEVESHTYSVPTTFHFVYQEGEHIATIADWAFGKEYELLEAEND
jgi:hypothetical protein